MISNRILQTTVDGLKAISRVDLCIVDADKNVAAKTFDKVLLIRQQKVRQLMVFSFLRLKMMAILNI